MIGEMPEAHAEEIYKMAVKLKGLVMEKMLEDERFHNPGYSSAAFCTLAGIMIACSERVMDGYSEIHGEECKKYVRDFVEGSANLARTAIKEAYKEKENER